MEEIYSAIITLSLILAILSIGIVFAIVRYKLRQQSHLKETKAMQEAFEKQLMQSQIEVQEATLAELSKDLHDNVGQLLSSTKMLLGITQRTLGEVPETLGLAEQTLGSAINELRALAKSLDRDWLAQFDLITNLETEINRINAAKVLAIEFAYSEKLPLEPQKQIILFRVVQEALQNCIKHACAKAISVDIQLESNLIILSVRDNGKGHNVSEEDNGMGIRNMKQRVQLLGGTIKWQACDPGTVITIQIPVNVNSTNDEN